MNTPNTPAKTDGFYDNFSDEMLIEAINGLESEAQEATLRVKRAKNALLERKAKDIKIALMQKTEPFGSVTQNIGGFKVTYNTPKKVEWRQDLLADIYAQIKADPNECVEDYIELEYNVPESKYKNFPTNIRSAFLPARTVMPGNVSVKIEVAKE